MMGSPTPSQLSTFGNKVDPVSLYGAPNYSMNQRGVSNPSFQTSITPTSNLVAGGGVGSSGFPLNLQRSSQGGRPAPPLSPSRNMFSLGAQQHSLLSQLSAVQANSLTLNQMKQRTNQLAPGLLSASAFRGGTLGDPSAGLDLSDFPSLSSRTGQNSQLMANRNYVGMVSKPQQESTPEFQIQQEDFPALPGAQNPSSSSADSSSKAITSVGSYDQAVKDTAAALAASISSSNSSSISRGGGGVFNDKAVGSQSQRRGIQTHPDGTVSNIPAGMVTDQFGVVGLLTFIRASESEPNLKTLASGIDLTTLGLNLNSTDNLYSTFQSPWAEQPCRPQDIDYHVPAEYLTNMMIRDRLAPIKFNRYQEDLLFYLFYINPGDVVQILAAAELYQRDWRYHKEERVWITRAPGMEPLTKTATYERGTYVFFDVQNWRKIPKEFLLEYSKLEEKPTLPDMSSLHKSN